MYTKLLFKILCLFIFFRLWQILWEGITIIYNVILSKEYISDLYTKNYTHQNITKIKEIKQVVLYSQLSFTQINRIDVLLRSKSSDLKLEEKDP